jgi:hypothetical protein
MRQTKPIKVRTDEEIATGREVLTRDLFAWLRGWRFIARSERRAGLNRTTRLQRVSLRTVEVARASAARCQARHASRTEGFRP